MSNDENKATDRPGLLQRAFAAGCTRIAVVGLHPGAGARTVVENAVSELYESGIPTGVTRAPRVTLEADNVHDQVTRIELPAGTLVATTETLAAGERPLELVETADCTTTLGDLNIYRVTENGEVAVYGPEDPAAMDAVFRRLEEQCGGLVIADGAWERRSFAAPDLTQGVILVVGAGYSGTPERSAAAARTAVETFTIPRCSAKAREAWFEAFDSGRAIALTGDGGQLGVLLPTADPTEAIQAWGDAVAQVVFPDNLHDEFVGPLTRTPVRFTLVVKDPTRLHLAQVYVSAWTSKGGKIEAVEPINLLALATNPINRTGPDAPADAFCRLVAEAVPHVPVHDVRLEAERRKRKPFWKIW